MSHKSNCREHFNAHSLLKPMATQHLEHFEMCLRLLGLSVILLEERGKENAKDGPFLQSPFKAASHVISLNGETSHSPKLFTKLMIKFHI